MNDYIDYVMTREEFAERLTKLMESRNLTNKDIRRATGANYYTVCRWLAGTYAPAPALRKEILNELAELNSNE